MIGMTEITVGLLFLPVTFNIILPLILLVVWSISRSVSVLEIVIRKLLKKKTRLVQDPIFSIW